MNNEYKQELLAEIILYQPIVKTADFSSITNYVSDYVKKHINENDKFGSVIDIILPGILGASGFPILAGIITGIELLTGINFGSIISSIIGDVRNMLTSNKSPSTTDVDNIVKNNVASVHVDENELDDFSLKEALDLRNDFIKNGSNSKFNNSIVIYNSLKKQAGVKSELLKKALSVAIPVMSWIIRVVLISAGFMVAKDIATSVLPESILPTKDVKKFNLPVNPEYKEERLNGPRSVWTISNENIAQTLIEWAEYIYPDLQGKQDLIKSTNDFSVLIRYINKYNEGNTFDVFVVPNEFKSRKDVVDKFVVEIEKKIYEMSNKK